MASLPPTEGRVPLHSPKGANKRIRDATIERLRRLEGASHAQLGAAIRRCQREWDMERTLEFNASIAAGVGILLTLLGHPGWAWFSAGVLAFLAQHALQGWCPPMPVFRALWGVRTSEEIGDEITALRVLRGDFDFVARHDATRETILKDMVANKRSAGAFVGTSSAAAAAKEE